MSYIKSVERMVSGAMYHIMHYHLLLEPSKWIIDNMAYMTYNNYEGDCMAEFEVIFYEKENGDCLVEEFHLMQKSCRSCFS